ncbi:3-oxoacid CoA-transferase subunit B [Proteiniclasticum sp. C24MP]|uniref:3-oxoacid CoA-transferase subunit B n=1 Tax=Proteiniclasticum sp. C24MP TaxID=3374101 RepID=UPI0037541710
MDKAAAAKFIAKRIAGDLKKGSLVNLGVGLPTAVADYVTEDMDVLMHGENGVIGLGSTAFDVIKKTEGKDKKLVEQEDLVINAGAGKTGISKGASFFDSTVSFGIIRGGHIDATVLGTMEVAENGDIANYMIPGKKVAGMGGAMDLCVGAKKVFVATYHTAGGRPKILKKCTLPLTAKGVVTSIYTEMGVFDVTDEGIRVREYNPEYTLEEIKAATEAELIVPDDVQTTPAHYFENL